jgi:sensor histidine kinase YesM
MKIFRINFSKDSTLNTWLKRIAVAVFITIAIQSILIYVTYGTFEGVASLASLLDLTFTFLYFLSLFWFYPKLSDFIHSPQVKKLSADVVNLIEGLLVAASTLVLTALSKILPLWILLIILNFLLDDFNGSFDFEAIRQTSIVHIFIGLFFYYYVERERLKKKIQEEHLRLAELQREEFKNQLEKLKNKVNPDFLFGSLNSLDSLIEKDPDKAVKFVGHLSNIYRSFLNEQEQLVPLKKEIVLAESYMSLLKMQFGDSISFDINLKPQSLSLFLPPGSLQVLIESTVRTKELNEKYPLKIRISSNENQLYLIIEGLDNYEPALLNKSLENITERYRYLSSENIVIREKEGAMEILVPLLEVNYDLEE